MLPPFSGAVTIATETIGVPERVRGDAARGEEMAGTAATPLQARGDGPRGEDHRRGEDAESAAVADTELMRGDIAPRGDKLRGEDSPRGDDRPRGEEPRGDGWVAVRAGGGGMSTVSASLRRGDETGRGGQWPRADTRLGRAPAGGGGGTSASWAEAARSPAGATASAEGGGEAGGEGTRRDSARRGTIAGAVVGRPVAAMMAVEFGGMAVLVPPLESVPSSSVSLSSWVGSAAAALSTARARLASDAPALTSASEACA